jgi:hypothetical protein
MNQFIRFQIFILLFISLKSFSQGALGIGAYYKEEDKILNAVGIKYKFRLNKNTPTSKNDLKIIFSTRRTYTPGISDTYLLEANLYSNWVKYKDTTCLGWPPRGNYSSPGESGLWVSIPDYNLKGRIGIRQLDLKTFENFPRQNSGIDNISGLTKIETISQFDITGKNISIQYLRGETMTLDLNNWGSRFDQNNEINTFNCINKLPSGIVYRIWKINLQIENVPYNFEVVIPNDGGKYLAPYEIMSIVTEFFHQEGLFQGFFWDFEILKENSSKWEKIKKWKMFYKSDIGLNLTYGAKVSTYDNHNVLEISNDGTDTYFKLGDIFSILPPEEDNDEANRLIIYPNPTKDYINLKYPENLLSDYEFQIIDIQGSVKISGKRNNNKILDVRNLSPGIYFINLIGSNSKILYGVKFLKE